MHACCYSSSVRLWCLGVGVLTLVLGVGELALASWRWWTWDPPRVECYNNTQLTTLSHKKMSASARDHVRARYFYNYLCQIINLYRYITELIRSQISLIIISLIHILITYIINTTTRILEKQIFDISFHALYISIHIYWTCTLSSIWKLSYFLGKKYMYMHHRINICIHLSTIS